MTTLLRQCRVFICDDQLELRQALSEVIANLHGFRKVGEAANGDHCLVRLPAAGPDLLILDVNLPRGGPDLARAAKEILPCLKILVYTALQDARTEAEMRAAGADDYLVKTGRLSPLRDALYRVADA